MTSSMPENLARSVVSTQKEPILKHFDMLYPKQKLTNRPTSIQCWIPTSDCRTVCRMRKLRFKMIQSLQFFYDLTFFFKLKLIEFLRSLSRPILQKRRDYFVIYVANCKKIIIFHTCATRSSIFVDITSKMYEIDRFTITGKIPIV